MLQLRTLASDSQDKVQGLHKSRVHEMVRSREMVKAISITTWFHPCRLWVRRARIWSTRSWDRPCHAASARDTSVNLISRTATQGCKMEALSIRWTLRLCYPGTKHKRRTHWRLSIHRTADLISIDQRPYCLRDLIWCMDPRGQLLTI